MRPRLSIVMPVLNEAGLVTAALAELQGFRQRGADIVVADGGSRDGTPALAKPLADRVITAPRGRAAQMNAGAAAAAGNLLLFLHVDTRLPLNADAVLARTWSNGAVWGRFDVRLSGRLAAFRVVEGMMNRRSRLTGIATGDQAIFVRREVFRDIGGFPDIPLMEDIVLSKTLKRVARPACLRERVQTSSRRWEEHGVFRTILFMWWLRLRFFFGADPADLARRYYRPDS